MQTRMFGFVRPKGTPRFERIKGCLTVAVLITGSVSSAGIPLTQPCAGAGYRQFDFWLGEWDVFDVGSTQREATATITAVQNGCALREEYRDSKGGGGESLSMYDPRTNMWRQSWVSNKGQIVLIAGQKSDAAITLSGLEYGTAEGRLIRGVWSPVEGGVRETAERSTDNGKTWTPWFDIVFRPHVGPLGR